MDTIQWLLENADAPIRYRVLREFLGDETAAKGMEKELLANPAVMRWLKQLKLETLPRYGSREHGSADFCLENALPKLVQLGLHGGISQLADAVSAYIDKLEAVSFDGAYRGTNGFRLGSDYLGFYAILTANFLSLADLRHPVIQDYMLGSLDVLYQFVSKGDYDFYISDEERNGLKAVPAIWKNRKFIRCELSGENGFPYPLVYDIVGLHKLYALRDPGTDRKIEAVIGYISTDVFHDTVSDGYGVLISGDKKYHAMGWDPKYPGWFDAADYLERGNASKLLFFAQYITKYPAARKTGWLRGLHSCLDRYGTEDGRCCFPSGWLKERQGYAVNGSHLSFGENRNKKNWREIESTFYMQLLSL